jgi:hypothetical protein
VTAASSARRHLTSVGEFGLSSSHGLDVWQFQFYGLGERAILSSRPSIAIKCGAFSMTSAAVRAALANCSALASFPSAFGKRQKRSIHESISDQASLATARGTNRALRPQGAPRAC